MTKRWLTIPRGLALAAMLAPVWFTTGCGYGANTFADMGGLPEFTPYPVVKGDGGYGCGGVNEQPDLAPEPDLWAPDLFVCPVTDRLCDREFAFTPPVGNVQVVEIRGSFDNWGTGKPMMAAGGQWKTTVRLQWGASIQYKFRYTWNENGQTKEAWVPDPSNPNQVDDGFGGKNSVLSNVSCDPWVCGKPAPVCGASPPGAFDWRDAVMYFVFVDRFKDGSAANNAPISGVDGTANWKGGDWAGVREKVNDGYFTSLGVNALWITVPMDQTDARGLGDDGNQYSAFHGYWPRDLAKPERRFGSMAEIQGLVDDAHKKGIKIIIDYAMNHVHIDSPTYQQHKDWFNPLQINGVNCICGANQNGVDCGWDSGNSRRCWFRDYLPDFNFGNAAARAASIDNALWWLDQTKADGFRLDAVKHIELSWLTDLRQRLNNDVEPARKEHIYLVGETFTGDQGTIRRYVNPCTMMDGQFDFPLRASLNSVVLLRQGRMQDLEGFMKGNDNYYGPGAIMSTFIGNHDVPRVIHFAQDSPQWSNVWEGGRDQGRDGYWTAKLGWVGGESAYERVALAMAVLMTNRGVPLIYYGDEIGLPGAGDPDNRRMMDWSAGTQGGPGKLLDRMKKLGAARKAHPALRRGTRQTLAIDNDTWAYSMADTTETVFVVINRSDGLRTVGGLPAGAYKDELTGETVNGPSVSVPARSARILSK